MTCCHEHVYIHDLNFAKEAMCATVAWGGGGGVMFSLQLLHPESLHQMHMGHDHIILDGVNNMVSFYVDHLVELNF